MEKRIPFLSFDFELPTSCKAQGLMYARAHVLNRARSVQALKPQWLEGDYPNGAQPISVLADTLEELNDQIRIKNWTDGLLAVEVAKFCFTNHDRKRSQPRIVKPRLERVAAYVLAAPGADLIAVHITDTKSGHSIYPDDAAPGTGSLHRVVELAATSYEHTHSPITSAIQAGPFLGPSYPEAYVALRGYETRISAEDSRTLRP